MIHLSHRDLVAQSGSRSCYLHPHDSDLVVKITTAEVRRKKRDPNWQEWRHYHHIAKRHARLTFITACHGFIETDQGEGLVCDCVRDHNGEISTTLHNALLPGSDFDLKAVGQALDRFCHTIIAANIQLFDLNLKNILIRIRGDGSYQPMAVDLKGRFANREFLPVSTYLPYFSRRKLTRRCGRLMKRVAELS